MKYKILITDDSYVNRSYLKSILVDYNFELIEASSGDEALEIVNTLSLDGMILDLMMPGTNGLDILKTVRLKGFHFPVIIFTSDYKEITKNNCIDAGANSVLYKPTNPQNLLSVMKDLFPNISL